MATTYLINESQLKLILGEQKTIPQIVLDCKKFLDTHYQPGSKTNVLDGNISNEKIIGVITKGEGGKNTVVSNITPQQLFNVLEDEIKGDVDKGEKRDVLLKQIIMDWFNGKLDNTGNLSKNLSI